jgi:ABC-type sugar transport system ATPase subunit
MSKLERNISYNRRGEPNPDDEARPILEMKGICKYFGGLHALEEVDFELYHNEILALVGDNGAGKSTLIKVIAGVHTADRGEIFIEGEKVDIQNPIEARALGIETVYQELALVETRDVADNFFLGREPTKDRFGIWVDKKKILEMTAKTLKQLAITIPSLRTAIRHLSGGQRQALAVGRVIPWGARIVIMDEPTAALGVEESAKVLELVAQLKKQGAAIIIISHNLRHVFDVADRIFVLRGGKRVGTRIKRESNGDEIVKLITGAELV